MATNYKLKKIKPTGTIDELQAAAYGRGKRDERTRILSVIREELQRVHGLKDSDALNKSAALQSILRQI